MPLPEFEPVDISLPAGPARIRVCTLPDATSWLTQHRPTLRRHATGDAEWDWVAFVARTEATPGLICVALELGGQLQGLMELGTTMGTGERSRMVAGADMVYVEHLAVRPENRPPPVGARAVRGVGQALVIAARELAFAVGYSGRVGLHSDPNAEGFYRRLESLGMRELNREPCDDGVWLYFEMKGVP